MQIVCMHACMSAIPMYVCMSCMRVCAFVMYVSMSYVYVFMYVYVYVMCVMCVCVCIYDLDECILQAADLFYALLSQRATNKQLIKRSQHFATVHARFHTRVCVFMQICVP